MATSEVLAELRQRLRGAFAPSRSLDASLGVHLDGWKLEDDEFSVGRYYLYFGAANGVGIREGDLDAGRLPDCVPHLTGSRDDAFGLVERLMVERAPLFTVQQDLRFDCARGWGCSVLITVPSREFQGFGSGTDRAFAECKALLLALLGALETLMEPA
jgi:hypothetical protein